MEKVSALYASTPWHNRLRVEAGTKPCISLSIVSKAHVVDEARAFVRAWGNEDTADSGQEA